MIISHKYKFIFLKTRKTAGTSIEIALSEFCEKGDIITPIYPPEDERARIDKGYTGPQNYLVPYHSYSHKDWLQNILQGKRRKYYNHVPAIDVRRWIGNKTWNSYYKFCFERNPWDKAISLYYFVTKTKNNSLSFWDYLQSENTEHLSNYYIYTIDEKIAVDHVALYEDLNTEIEKITKILGLPKMPTLPRIKSGFRDNSKSKEAFFDEKAKKFISHFCKKEIELFSYSF